MRDVLRIELRVEEIGAPATALLPFLERGWTGAVVPIATPAEVLASLTIISVQPGSPVTDETIDQTLGFLLEEE